MHSHISCTDHLADGGLAGGPGRTLEVAVGGSLGFGGGSVPGFIFSISLPVLSEMLFGVRLSIASRPLSRHHSESMCRFCKCCHKKTFFL